MDRPRKRARIAKPPKSLVETRLSEELIVHCLSFLSVSDLARVALLSSHWFRLANDPSVRRTETSSRWYRHLAQLWKVLFLRRFAPRSRKRAVLPEQSSRSWKTMYKIHKRWLDGTARSTAINIRSSVLRLPPSDLHLDTDIGEMRMEDMRMSPNTIVRFSGHHFYVASRTATTGFPVVEIHLHMPAGPRPLAELIPTSLCTKELVAVTEIALDEGKRGRVAVFYSTGQFAIFDLHSGESWQEVFASSKMGDAVPLASLHSPLLVTCTKDFAVTFTSIAEFKANSTRLTLRRIASPMRTPLCWSPLVLTLRCADGNRGHFRVNIAHSAPHFPGAWTVALHEFDIDLEASPSRRVAARQVTAAPISSSLVTALEFRPPWLVASRADNTLDVFLARSSPPDGSPSTFSLEHWRTLFGHTAAVHTVSLGANGRCVSGGSDGRVTIWQLPDLHATGVTVLSENETTKPLPPPPSVSWLGFDEEKIVMVRSPIKGSTGASGQESVDVLSFD